MNNILNTVSKFFGWTSESKKPIEFGYDKPINLNISSKIYTLKNSIFENYIELKFFLSQINATEISRVNKSYFQKEKDFLTFKLNNQKIILVCCKKYSKVKIEKIIIK